MSVIAYSSLSLRDIAKEVSAQTGIQISQNIVSKALDMLGHSKQRNQKMEQLGEPHPDRDVQFRHINDTGTKYIVDGALVISVDCKKERKCW